MTISSLKLDIIKIENAASLIFDFDDGTALILYGNGRARHYPNLEDKMDLLRAIEERKRDRTIVITRLV